MSETTEDYMTPAEVQAALQISRTTLYKVIAQMERDGVPVKRLSKRTLRIDRRAFEQWMKNRGPGSTQ